MMSTKTKAKKIKKNKQIIIIRHITHTGKYLFENEFVGQIKQK